MIIYSICAFLYKSGHGLLPYVRYLLYLLPIKLYRSFFKKKELYRRIVAKGKYKDGPYDS
jgi:hypothetical protein